MSEENPFNKIMLNCQSRMNHVTSFDDLGADVIMFEILSRLPAKYVGRSKSVCKQWLALLSTHEFAMTNSRHLQIFGNQKMLALSNRSASVISLDIDSSNMSTCTVVSLPFKCRPYDLFILSSLDGLLCVCCRPLNEMVIWNPLTSAYKMLSDSSCNGFYKSHSDVVSLYVNSDNDYRILHIKCSPEVLGGFIYSRRSGEWREMGFLNIREYQSSKHFWSAGTKCGSGIYYLVRQEPLLADRILIRFDVNSEQFTTIQLPCVMYSRICQGYLVNVLNNLQIFVVNFANGAGVELYKFEGELWMKLLSLPFLYLPLSVWSSVTYSRRYGKWIFMANWGEIFIMDLQENVLDAVNFYPVFWMHGLKGSLYKESVLSPTY